MLAVALGQFAVRFHQRLVVIVASSLVRLTMFRCDLVIHCGEFILVLGCLFEVKTNEQTVRRLM